MLAWLRFAFCAMNFSDLCFSLRCHLIYNLHGFSVLPRLQFSLPTKQNVNSLFRRRKLRSQTCRCQYMSIMATVQPLSNHMQIDPRDNILIWLLTIQIIGKVPLASTSISPVKRLWYVNMTAPISSLLAQSINHKGFPLCVLCVVLVYEYPR